MRACATVCIDLRLAQDGVCALGGVSLGLTPMPDSYVENVPTTKSPFSGSLRLRFSSPVAAGDVSCIMCPLVEYAGA